MAPKKSKKKDEERGLSRMLAGTIILGVVFSAGLITGQRVLRSQGRAPMVSLASVRHADGTAASIDEAESANDLSKTALRTTFSFYDHLTQDAAAATTPKPSPAEAKPTAAEAKPAAAEAKPEDAKPEPAKAEPAPAPAPVAKPTPAAPNAEPKPAEAAKPAPVEVIEKIADSIAPEKPAPAAALPARYTLQVSSHPDRSSAENELARLNKMGVEPHIVVVNVPGRGELWRVRVGKFHTMDEARDFQGSMKSRRGVAGFVTPL